jgi:hypothetical protein
MQKQHPKKRGPIIKDFLCSMNQFYLLQKQIDLHIELDVVYIRNRL